MAQASKLAARGALTESKLAGLSTALRGGAALGGAAGAAATGGLLVAALGIKFALEQGFKMLGENLAPSILAKNFSSALQSEFILGNFRHQDQRQFGLTEYGWYRNQMRQMGVRDEKVIADEIRKAVEQGIAGGPSRADAVGATLSRTAILKTLGIDVGSSMGALYRATQDNRSMFQNRYGDFDLQRFAQTFGYLAKASENVNGVQISIKDWYSIFDQLKDRFRGTTNDFGAFQRGLTRFSEALTKNEATIGDVTAMYRAASGGMSDSSLFTMFALQGTRGGDLLNKRLQFIRRGFDAEGVGYNIQNIARGVLNIGNITGGGNEALRDKFMRDYLRTSSLSEIADRVPNLDKFFSSLLNNDAKATEDFERYTTDTKQYLQNQTKKMDAIIHPLQHIRDLFYGYIQQKWVTDNVEEILKAGAKRFAPEDAEARESYSAKARQKQQEDVVNKLSEMNTTLRGIREDANNHAIGNKEATNSVVTAIENSKQNVALGEEH